MTMAPRLGRQLRWRFLPKRRQYAVIAALAIVAAIVIVLAAEPFAESLLATGTQLGVDRFFLVHPRRSHP